MTVSGNDLKIIESAHSLDVLQSQPTVSSCDLTSCDMSVGEQLNSINNGIYLIAFFIIFVWIETRIRNAIGRWFGNNGKSD